MVAVALVAACAPIAAIEAIIARGLAHPAFAATLPAPLLRGVLGAYDDVDRALVNLDEATARYDPVLLYTLRPGRFTFANREFSTGFEVNSLGVRDSEAALSAPEVLVTGDSYAMGWGVEHDNTFAARIGKATGLRVLDAAVASYGTVRELALLGRADTSHARTLIVQYCRNDLLENQQFRLHGDRHQPSPEGVWRAAIANVQARHRYFPGRYTGRALFVLLGWNRDLNPVAGAATPEEAELFLNALQKASPAVPLARLHTIVLDPTNPREVEDPSSFVRALAACLRAPEHQTIAASIRVLDVAPLLSADDYYLLDDHLRASGHAKVAKAMVEAMGDG